MHNSDNEPDAKPTTIPMYPRRPHTDDPRWRDVTVRARTQSQTNIMRFPIDGKGIDIMSVYAGDTIAIIPEVRHEYYVAARVGYHVGWINFQHVKLLSLKPGKRGTILEDTKPDIPKNRTERINRHQAMQAQKLANIQNVETSANITEDETQPQRVKHKPPPIAKKDVHRIIDKLKSLGGLLSRR